MNTLSDAEGFEWDKGNLQKSWQKHKVTPAECEEAFFNSPLVVTTDEPHSGAESRYFVLGKTDNDRLLFIAFTMRNRKIRVISARDMSRKERRVYHEKAKEVTEIQE